MPPIGRDHTSGRLPRLASAGLFDQCLGSSAIAGISRCLLCAIRAPWVGLDLAGEETPTFLTVGDDGLYLDAVGTDNCGCRVGPEIVTPGRML
jgi:hypothetical protein